MGRRGRDRMVVGCTTTYAISAYHYLHCEFEPRSDEVYSIQHYVIKFVSDLQQVGIFLRVHQSSTNETVCHDVRKILLKVVLNTMTYRKTYSLTSIHLKEC